MALLWQLSSTTYAGPYDNAVLDQVSAKDFVQILSADEATEKAFVRTQMPRAGDNRCSITAGRPNSLAISKLRIVGGEANAATPTPLLSDASDADIAAVPYYGSRLATVHLAVRFAIDSDQLGVKDNGMLDELASALGSTKLVKGRFAIVGHTDATGPYRRNLELSCARAIAVRNYLIAKGVNPNRLTSYGFGPDSPLLNVQASSSVNRRVEISRSE